MWSSSQGTGEHAELQVCMCSSTDVYTCSTVAARWLDYGCMHGRDRESTEHFQMALVAIGLLVSGERCDTNACRACHLKRT